MKDLIKDALYLTAIVIMLYICGCAGTVHGFGTMVEGAGHDIQAMSAEPYNPN